MLEDATCQRMLHAKGCRLLEDVACQRMPHVRRCHMPEDGMAAIRGTVALLCHSRDTMWLEQACRRCIIKQAATALNIKWQWNKGTAAEA